MASGSAQRASIDYPPDGPTAFLDWLPGAAIVLDNEGRVVASNRGGAHLRDGPAVAAGHTLAEALPDVAAGLNLPYFRRDTSTREFELRQEGRTVQVRLQPFYDGYRHLLVVQ